MKDQIIRKAAELGFTCCGFGNTEPFEELRDFYTQFIATGCQADLGYLERYAATRLDPRRLMAEARTVIAVLMNYYPRELLPEADNYVIAKYAYGKDGHSIVKERLSGLAGFLRDSLGSRITRAFHDSGPLLEKALAMRCGTGWIGKNTLLVNRRGGSFFLIGILLTDLEIVPDLPEKDHCGHCEICMKACPTGAIDVPYRLNIPRCISYLTIEKKTTFPETFLPLMHDRIYGCDICQDVCPYNRSPEPTQEAAFVPDKRLKEMRKKEWNRLTEDEFQDLFRDSAIRRIGYEKIISTIRQIGSSGDSPLRH